MFTTCTHHHKKLVSWSGTQIALQIHLLFVTASTRYKLKLAVVLMHYFFFGECAYSCSRDLHRKGTGHVHIQYFLICIELLSNSYLYLCILGKVINV